MTRFGLVRPSFLHAASVALAALALGCQQPIRCGALNEYCCVDEAGGGFCLSEPETGLRLRCNAAMDICEPDGSAPACGALGQACCATGAACNAGLRCNESNACEVDSTAMCGALGQACCAGGACSAADLSCQANVCTRTTTGTACPGTTGACDIGLQDCGGGQACALSIEGTTSCRAAGSGGDQSPCTDDTQCAVGHYCSPFSGRCHPQCCGATQCSTSQTCIVTAATGNAGLCFGSPCDPVGQTGCTSSASCYLGGNPAGGVLTMCLPPGSGTQGSACSAIDDCAPGLGCLGDPGSCAQLCRPSSPSCSVGTCNVIEGASDLGACL